MLFCSAGIISATRIHLQLALLFHRDYFGHPDSSPACSFVPQGLFRPPGFISILLFCSTGIISATRIHPQLAFLFHRDYFDRPNSSPACFFVPQGLLCPSQIHLYLALLFHRDYFAPVRFISIWLFCATGIISTDRIHPQLAFFFRRDYFHWPDSSLTSSFVPQGLFRPPGFISIWLFCTAGIISTDRIHPTAEMHLCRAIQQPEIYCSSILPIFSAITRVPTAITETPISIT